MPGQVVARKYNSTTKKYDDVPNATITETTLGGKHALQVSYILVDNGPSDTNPAEGKIADPIGLGIQAVAGLADTGRPAAVYLFLASVLIAMSTWSARLGRKSRQYEIWRAGEYEKYLQTT